MITHTIESKEDKVKITHLKKSPKYQIFELWNGHYTRHTFWSCLIRCANMKWIRWVLLKIQSGHDSVHRRTDGQGDTSIPPFNFVEAEGIDITNWTLRNKLQWNFNRNSNNFIQENAFEVVVCEMAAILFRPECVNSFAWIISTVTEPNLVPKQCIVTAVHTIRGHSMLYGISRFHS